MESARVEQAVERFSEDEALWSDPLDPAASALLAWIEQQIEAADATVDDDAFAQRVNAIRAAALVAGRAGSSAAPDELVAKATALLTANRTGGSAAPPNPTMSMASTATGASGPTSAHTRSNKQPQRRTRARRGWSQRKP